MKEITFYEVTYNSDGTEGRGTSLATGTGFTSQAAAMTYVRSAHYAQEHGVMGTPGGIHDIKPVTFRIYDSFDEWVRGQPDRKRAAALAKLTEEDRQVLGL